MSFGNPLSRKIVVNYLLVSALCSAVLFFASGLLHYSPVPFWDTWTGNVNFNALANIGDKSSWWALHNEHRIVLSKLLFWIDEHWFSGSAKFLIATNYCLILLSIFVFSHIAKSVSSESTTSIPICLKLLAIMFLMSWVQQKNLVWSFQSQFFLAFLLPLTGLYCLHLSREFGQRYFFLAVFLGLLSVGSMANGIMALPLMTLYSLLARFSYKRTLLLAGVSVLSVTAYFCQYTSYQGEGSFTRAIVEHPLDIAQFLLLYLSSPFYWLLGKTEIVQWLSYVMSALLILVCVRYLTKLLLTFKQNTLALSLLLFILYVGGSAFGTAAGRVVYGIAEASSSRYTTPAIMLWVSFGLLMWLQEPRLHRHANNLIAQLLAIVLSILLLCFQFKAMAPDIDNQRERYLAALAITIGANDQDSIHKVYWNSKELLETIGRARSQHIAIFGMEPFRTLQNKWGKHVSTGNAKVCKGYIDSIQPLINEERFLKLNGWVATERSNNSPSVGYVLDKDNTLNGVLLTGYDRQDVAKALGYRRYNGGFHGYIDNQATNGSVSIFFPSLDCVLESTISDASYSAYAYSKNKTPHFALRSQVVSAHDWTGSDFNKSEIEQFDILGSYIRGDVDTGRISLLLNRGQKVIYRSGPITTRQFLTIGSNIKQRLPLANDWTVLHFNSQQLPSTFTVTFSDEGDDWGEWSAIGVKHE